MHFDHYSYHDEISKTLSSDQSRNLTFLVGRFDSYLFDTINGLDDSYSLVSHEIFLEDRLLVGKKANRHLHQGNQLDLKEWELIPYAIINCCSCYFDRRTENIIFMIPSLECDRAIKLAVHLNFNLGREKRKINLIRSCFKINPQAIEEDSKRYIDIDGL
ncbi:MAG: hypothetical protein QM523_05820 [Candidatus Pacebacteria bacterium]|nr:hypothetical protein [Candidatus Paceibacterota bacterium]